MYCGQDKDLVEFIIYILDILLSKNRITPLTYLVMFSYILTPLVSDTIAKRLTISDKKSTRYMSKQNAHQNIIRDTINKVLDYARTEIDPALYKMFLPKNSKHLKTILEKNNNEKK